MATLAAQLAAIAERNVEDLERVARASLLRLGNLIIQGTPVDTGRAQNNWLTALGSPDKATRGAGAQSLGDLSTTASGLQAGQVMYFTNSLPYIERLEYGHSQQAPQGMLRLSLVQWQRIVSDEVAKV